MTSLQKKFLIISGLAVFLLCSTSFGVLKYQNSELLDGQESDAVNIDIEDGSGDDRILSDVIDTSNWKTYRNEEFEIKYPPELIGKEIIWEGYSDKGYYRSYIYFNLPKLGENLYPNYMFEAAGPLNNCVRGQSPPVWQSQQTLDIGGVTFTKAEYLYPEDVRVNTVQYYGKHQDVCYYLTYTQANQLIENVTRFEHIVSTFTRINSQ